MDVVTDGTNTNSSMSSMQMQASSQDAEQIARPLPTQQPPLIEGEQLTVEQQHALQGQQVQQFSQQSTSQSQDSQQAQLQLPIGQSQQHVSGELPQEQLQLGQQLQLQQQFQYQQQQITSAAQSGVDAHAMNQPMTNGLLQQQLVCNQQVALQLPMGQVPTQQQCYISQNTNTYSLGAPPQDMQNVNNQMTHAELPVNGGVVQPPQMSQIMVQSGQELPQQIAPVQGQYFSGGAISSSIGELPENHALSPALQPAPQAPTNTAAAPLHSSVGKSWHSASDSSTRQKMQNRIVTVLSERRPNAPSDWVNKLPQMAKRLEEALYSHANSFDEYRDEKTLKVRLQQYALSVSRNNQSNRTSAPTPLGQVPQQNAGPGRSQLEQRIMGGHQQNLSARPAGVGMSVNQNVGQYAPQQDSNQSTGQYHQQQQVHMQQGQVGMVNGNEMSEEDKLIVGNSNINQDGAIALNDQSKPSGSNQQREEQRKQEHRRQVLKQQQQRLLLLRHASKCPHENCTVTQHCAGMKKLWKHIMSCKEHDCKESHCVSSRYVLSHYSKCKEKECPVCGPVREAIRRNYEKSRAIVALSKANNDGGGSRVAPEEESKGKKAKAEIGPDGKPVRRRKQQTKKQKEEEQKAAQAKGTQQQQQQQQQQYAIQQAPKILPKTDALDPVSCSIYGFSTQQIEAHLRGIHEGVRLNTGEIKNIMMPIVDGLLKHHSGYIFANPVDPVAFNLPDYFDIIKMPMDLGTVKKKLESSQYRDPFHVLQEISLTFDNAILYNPKDNDIHKVAIQMKAMAEKQYKNAMAVHNKKLEEARMDPDACSLCGEEKMYFEPPVFYCQGKCGGQRIRRNAWYYSTSNNQNHWCSNCFNDMKQNQRIELPDMTITKEQLAASKKKHEHETPELSELWVACDICDRWVHQVCGLFNCRRNTSEAVAFVCPVCVVDRRAKNGSDVAITSKKMKASDLPHNSMSRFIETRVSERVERAYDARAELIGKPREEIEKCPNFFIRQVSCVDKNQQVREGVRDRYKHKGYPTEFPCRTKCVILFQNIDGQDVVLFGMYVYEYGHKCPQPNQRRVYVSYLDSVHYFRPRHYRTIVYQEIIVSYLEYVKNRGFHTAHIWACPPLKGDDYILYCHPQDQKTPKDDRLRQWYVDVLKTCKERNIAVELTDLYTEFLADMNNDGTVLPYFEGDYWVNEAEVIIKELSKTTAGKLKLSEGNIVAPEETTTPKKNKTKRTRSSKGELIIPGARNRDIVMAKLATIIQPMKEAFFVAKLHPQEYADKYAKALILETEGEIKSSVDDSEESVAKRAKIEEESVLNSEEAVIPGGTGASELKQSSSSSKNNAASSDVDAGSDKKEESTAMEITSAGGATEAKEVAVKIEVPMETSESATGSILVSDGKDVSNKVASTPNSTTGAKMLEEIDRSNTAEAKPADTHVSEAIDQKSETSGNAENIAERNDTKAAEVDATEVSVTALATKSENAIKEERLKELFKFKNDNTDDIDETSEAEHTYFNTRQDVLQLCQGNHYQFDQLRRAKHTSMMILYHLHNPDAPKFVPSCTLCTKDILSGYRHHCETCEIDICHQCYTTRGTPNQLHQHPLRAVSVVSGQPTQQLTEEQKKEREKSIQMHLHLLNHASSCNSQCKSKNCARMRDFLRHDQTCKNGTKGGCPLCKKIYNLLTLHARSCKSGNCRVPKCNEIRDQMRKMELRQQAMDDRRRAMMNQTYGQQGSSATAAYE